ncbi:MAG: tetratricopeptide repeat protein [Leptospirillia bacterium]
MIRLILGVLCVSAVLVAPVAADELVPQVPAPEAASANGTLSIAAAWSRVRETSSLPLDVADFDAAIRTLMATGDEYGVENFETAAIALSKWAVQASQRGDAASARHLARGATQVAPRTPDGYLAHASVLWADGSYIAAIGWWLEGSWVGIGHYWVGFAWLTYAALMFWLAAATTLVVFLIPGLIQSVRSFCHHLLEFTGFRVPSALLLAGLVAVLLMPLAGGWGVGWAVLLWALFSWVGDPSRNRNVQVFLLMTVLLGPWVCSPFMAVNQDPGGDVEFALDQSRGGFMPGSGISLARSGDGHSGDWRVPFALGNAALREGRYDDAIGWYKKAEDVGGDTDRTRNNIATALFRSGRFDDAERIFSELAEAPHPDARILFNLGQMLSRRLDFTAARPVLERARKVDSATYLRISSLGTERSDVYVVPFGVSGDDARQMILAGATGWQDYAGALWSTLFGRTPAMLAPVLMMLVAGAFFMVPRLLPSSPTYNCDICHRTVCQRCIRFNLNMLLCGGCGNQVAESRGTRMDVTLLKDRHSHRPFALWWVLARLLPGVPDLIQERFGVAVLHLMLVSFLIWWMVLLGTIPGWAMSVPPAGWPVPRLLGGLALALYVGTMFLVTGRGQVYSNKASRKGGSRPDGAAAG